MQGPAPDQRQHPRFAYRLSAEVHDAGTDFTAMTRDLSVGGVCIESDRLIAEGNTLAVGLFLVIDDVEDASAPPLEMRGKVAWSTPGDATRPGSMGIRFEGLSAKQMAGLQRFLKIVPPSQ